MKTKDIARQAIIAALYAAICVALAPISYGAIQLRISEMLMVLPFYNKKYTVGLTLGCLIANLYSPELGLWDPIFGTLATLIACLIISRLETAKFVALAAAAVNGVIIGAMLYFVLGLPFMFSAATVAIGEFIAVFAGVAVMKALERNDGLKAILEARD